ncbi:hypothetical protein JTE90_029341 [Oedothorax gibbosus]|uniref:Uncharacterized protein n=1 Tax=Oedothorax gibbosus TaxID=931172 RepID=A0AAV6UJF2_9ARAC|nr:hypothetical protein JTE90_029341 [Oedothorax gibbosus]
MPEFMTRKSHLRHERGWTGDPQFCVHPQAEALSGVDCSKALQCSSSGGQELFVLLRVWDIDKADMLEGVNMFGLSSVLMGFLRLKFTEWQRNELVLEYS